MAGHSQFKNIMYRKGAQDAKRAKVFAKITREIMVAAKAGGPDSAMNARLRAALSAAREANVPKDNVERAIKKVTGGEGDTHYEEIRYEGYGPGGVAVIVETLTDNRNRTASEIRSIFSKNGGALGETGSVSYQFERVGLVVYDAAKVDFDTIFQVSVDASADNVEVVDQRIEITCAVTAFSLLRDNLQKHLGDFQEAKIIWRPQTPLDCGSEAARSLLKLLELLEDNDDVQSVYSNAHINDAVMEAWISA